MPTKPKYPSSALSGLDPVKMAVNDFDMQLPGGPAYNAMHPQAPNTGVAFDEARKVGDQQTQRFAADMLDMDAQTPVGSFGDAMGVAPKGAHSYFPDTSKSSHADVPMSAVARTHSKKP